MLHDLAIYNFQRHDWLLIWKIKSINILLNHVFILNKYITKTLAGVLWSLRFKFNSFNTETRFSFVNTVILMHVSLLIAFIVVNFIYVVSINDLRLLIRSVISFSSHYDISL